MALPRTRDRPARACVNRPYVNRLAVNPCFFLLRWRGLQTPEGDRREHRVSRGGFGATLSYFRTATLKAFIGAFESRSTANVQQEHGCRRPESCCRRSSTRRSRVRRPCRFDVNDVNALQIDLESGGCRLHPRSSTPWNSPWQLVIGCYFRDVEGVSFDARWECFTCLREFLEHFPLFAR